MGFFFINKEVFPIGISLYKLIRGTKSDSKLNLLLINFIINLPNSNRFINIMVIVDYFIKMRYIIPIDWINTILVAKCFIKYVFKLYKLFNLIVSN